MILYWDHSVFPDGPDDLFYARVHCLWDTYGPGHLAEFWIQKIGEETTAWLCCSEGCITLSVAASADWEELAEFVLFLGAPMVYGPQQLVLPGEYTAKIGEILCWNNKGKMISSLAGLSFDTIRNPSGGQLYTLLSQCQSDSLMLPLRDGFISDYMRRVRLNTGRAKLLCSDGKGVSAVMTTAETLRLAVIGGVSALPEYRGQGLATTALALMTDELSREGKQIFLAAGSAELARFYEKRGFAHCGKWRLWQVLS